jgi:hypothetical protein
VAITYNTGTTANSGSFQTTTQAVTVPAGVLAGDVVLMKADIVVLTGTPPTITASSTGTAPSLAGSEDSGSESLPAAVTGAVFYFVASGSDAGKVVTFSAGVVGGFWAVALAAYTGASSSSPIDVIQGAFGGANTATVTCPTLDTGVAGDWAVYLGGGAAEGGNLTIPSGTTSRQSVSSSANIAEVICDSGGSVGGSGTPIGGGTFTTTIATNSILTAFTVGLAPPAATGVSGSLAMALAPMALGKSGSETVPGMTGMTLAPMTLALSGRETIPGSASLALTPMKLTLSGAETVPGSMGVALAPMTLALTGSVVGQHVTATMGMALAPMRLQLAAAETMPGSLTAALAPMKLSATAAETMPGSASLALAPMRLDATAQQVGQGVTGNMIMAMAPMKFTGGISGKITQAQGAAHVIAVPLELLIQGAPRTGGQEPWAA